ncbi:MAG: DUF2061 domain-containing protein [Saprospiraceae bacterium]
MIIEQVLKRNSEVLKEKDLEKKTEKTETTKRSLAKTISWRVIGTLDTILISWLITGTFAFAISIGAIELFTKMVLYFFHERAWNNIKFGK